MPEIIYKIATVDQWKEAIERGSFDGAPIDLTDGYLHFSTAGQVRKTAAKHFKGQDNLLLIAIDAEQFGSELKYEVSRGGALFPHLYGKLNPEAAISVTPLPMLKDGYHQFPEDL